MDIQKTMQEIDNYFLNASESIAVAESVTSGSLQLNFSQMENASRFYYGGITTYNLKQKIRLLKIDPEEGKRTNCVSKHLTETMALNVQQLFQSDWAMAITGYATPVKESGFTLYAYYAICHKKVLLLSDKIDGVAGDDAKAVQDFYSGHLLKELLKLL
ncbi:MAG TPA: nicotinamide-nucleotide amidohydrolase family protein [Edaphocola sp.]|nr:nicotinamide-nucleotide amidohydrolase family protein [Edaphocola sp.]